MTAETEDAARKALELYPGSMRALALEAGVDPSLLVRIRSGDRSATLDTLSALLAALERLRDRHADAANILREALEAEEESDG